MCQLKSSIMSLSILTKLIVCISMLVFSDAISVHYVKPNNSSPLSCPGQPCLTIDQYTQQPALPFKSGSMFVFLAGNHSLQTAVNLTHIANITFRGISYNSSVHITEGNFHCLNVTNMTIEGLIFLLNYSEEIEVDSVLVIVDSKIFINSTVFETSGGNFGRAVNVQNSTLTVLTCLFKRNTGNNGGAIYASAWSNVTLNSSIFVSNEASSSGGAIFAEDRCILIINGGVFLHNRAGNDGGAISVRKSYLYVHGIPNEELPGSVNYISLCNSNFQRNEIDVEDNISLSLCRPGVVFFSSNKALRDGGAVHLKFSSSFDLAGTTIAFSNNSAYDGGGLMSHTGTNILKSFIRTRLVLNAQNMYFIGNTAKNKGGAINVQRSDLFLGLHSKNNQRVMKFEKNSAIDGGGIYGENIKMYAFVELPLKFVRNTAQGKGGGIHFSKLDPFCDIQLSHANFINNTAKVCGGAGYLAHGKNIKFQDVAVVGNSQSALCITECKVDFSGMTYFRENTGQFGGGIAIFSQNTYLSFNDDVVFKRNIAWSGHGGAIYAFYRTVITFRGCIHFAHNLASADGGAIYALETNITMLDGSQIHFNNNTAENGGAMYLNELATLTLDRRVSLNTSGNQASKYGGVLYHEDNTIPLQCNFENIRETNEVSELPYCFLKFTINEAEVISVNDSARIDGNFMFGGLLDRCQMQRRIYVLFSSQTIVPFEIFMQKISVEVNHITSKPYQLCFCDYKSINCSRGSVTSIEVHRGQKFSLSLLAKDQLRRPISIPYQVNAKVLKTARLKLNQSSQTLQPNCSSLSYALYSTARHEELILYTDGPCTDTGIARAVVNITLLPCPDGFVKSAEQCICEKRLEEHGAECFIEEEIYILRNKFWIKRLYSNSSYKGLILYKTCPALYCKDNTLRITLDNPDIQCANNRSGMLCGACATNYSLMLGSSRCGECSNTYLALLLPFASAGIALVVFLSILRLTVATGMINGVILYANIIQVNKDIFFPTNNRNIVTVFIAWMNLELGFEACFYNGMTAYQQTWFQFAFPVYIWILITVMILTSRYSITLSKLIGHNPIAVLATLLLMSYTKVLKIIIDVYSSVDMDYPKNKTATVWLKDANVPYLQSWHLFLTVVTSVVLIFIFLPYTLLLLLGYRLYRYSGKRYLHWLNRLKPLLDSYYAPYKIHTRYWTGFLLLVRCFLYIVFSFNPLGGMNKSLLTIIITFSVIGLSTGYLASGKMHRKLHVSIMETSIYLNLIVLSAITLAGLSSAALVYSLVGIVFVTMIGIIVYHFHITYTAKSAMWLKVCTGMTNSAKELQAFFSTYRPPTDAPVHSSSHDPHKIVTKTVIELREPLLENS